jgi:hypothetical protein
MENNGSILLNLRNLLPKFQNSINGCAPKSLTDKDTRGWGNSLYSIIKGYKLL